MGTITTNPVICRIEFSTGVQKRNVLSSILHSTTGSLQTVQGTVVPVVGARFRNCRNVQVAGQKKVYYPVVQYWTTLATGTTVVLDYYLYHSCCSVSCIAKMLAVFSLCS